MPRAPQLLHRLEPHQPGSLPLGDDDTVALSRHPFVALGFLLYLLDAYLFGSNVYIHVCICIHNIISLYICIYIYEYILYTCICNYVYISVGRTLGSLEPWGLFLGSSLGTVVFTGRLCSLSEELDVCQTGTLPQ